MSSWPFYSFTEGTEFRKPVPLFVSTKSKVAEAAEHLVPGPGPAGEKNMRTISASYPWVLDPFFLSCSFTEGTEFRKPVSVFVFTKLKVAVAAERWALGSWTCRKKKHWDHLRRFSADDFAGPRVMVGSLILKRHLLSRGLADFSGLHLASPRLSKNYCPDFQLLSYLAYFL